MGAGDMMNLPFVIILSDGRFNKNNVRPYLAEAREKRYLYIFVILDSVKENTGSTKKSDGSILSMKSVEKTEGSAGIKLVPYLKDFPFEYYCIVRDVHQLPAALGNILVQWFSLINNNSMSV
jgi:midasin